MLDARLALALGGGGLDLPEEGSIGVWGAVQAHELSDLPKDRVTILQGFKPDYDTWSGRGFDVDVQAEDSFAISVVCLPRAKDAARALIAEACDHTDGIVVIDGQKTDGADSILREMRGRVTVHGPIAKAHGKLFWITDAGADCFADWRMGPELTEGGFWTAPGVFSADGVDLASALLVEALPDDLGAEVADLGAGWGFLAAHVLTRDDVKAVHLVEAGHMALECAKRNVTDERARFHWADATEWDPDARMDSIVMNPPFHVGRAAEPQIGQAFVKAAARLLKRSGNLWMVANRHLPYEAELQKRFAQVEEIGGDARFKLFHASRPIGARNRT